jgi:hypothetical protein
MLLVGFESEIPASERPQTYTLDRAITGIGGVMHYGLKMYLGGRISGMRTGFW